MKHYRSSIPKAARESVVATFVASPSKYMARCTLNGKLVGTRVFHETGELSIESPFRNGLLHGIRYWSDVPGMISFAEPYFNGLPHGVAKQWSDEGKLIGTYTMRHGTGLDLWRGVNPEDGIPRLYEARYLKDGKWHGFEWWLDHQDQKRLWQECHYWNDQRHGIERSWNWSGGLRRGYPRYWVGDKRVTKRQYLRACAKDPALPPFREKDNRPDRKFPPEVAMNCVEPLRPSA
jgi:hypothetical protein